MERRERNPDTGENIWLGAGLFSSIASKIASKVTGETAKKLAEKVTGETTQKLMTKAAEKGMEKIGEKTGEVIGQHIEKKFKPIEKRPSPAQFKGEEVAKLLQKQSTPARPPVASQLPSASSKILEAYEELL